MQRVTKRVPYEAVTDRVNAKIEMLIFAVGQGAKGKSAGADIPEPEQEKGSRGHHHRPGHLRVS